MTTRSDENIPLCVDLDGTLIRSDLLIESFFALLKCNPFYIFLVPLWLSGGKAHLKEQIAKRVEIDVTSLPYHDGLLHYLREEKKSGRQLVLATATNQKFAHNIANYLGLFDEIFSSDKDINLSGRRKSERLLLTYGDKKFDYAGNAPVDLKIWRHARQALLVNPTHNVEVRAAQVTRIGRVFQDDKKRWRVLLRAMRPHQWMKNLLIFIPLAASHQLKDVNLLMLSGLAFLAFGLCASSVYLLNDLLDLNSDRLHPRKRLRPFAHGDLSLWHGMLLIPVLLGSAFTIALFLSPLFLLVLIGYYTLTLAYSLRLKQVLLLDVVVLAGLYTMRLIAGGAAVSVTLSFWLLAFSMFIFFSLAMAKRYTELLSVQTSGATQGHGRGYQITDLEPLLDLGASSGLIAVLVLALYINSDIVNVMYRFPEAIWLLCPLLLYWIGRIWFLARRGKLHDDPLVFAVRDRVSLGVAGLAGLIVLLAV